MTDDCRKVTDGETQVIINITTGANTIAVSPSQASFSSGIQYISLPFIGNIVLISYFCSVIKTKNDIYILELKVDDTVDNALAQIDSK